MPLPWLGYRVTRGPDWSPSNSEDGGLGGVGTVIAIRNDALGDAPASEGATTSSDPSSAASLRGGTVVSVVWDTGGSGNYCCGSDGKCELLVFDTAAAGVCHTGTHCDACGERDIAGIRWRCQDCVHVSLCSQCYYRNKHDIDHGFCCMACPNIKRDAVPKRSDSYLVRIFGIFAGAKVTRCIGRQGDAEQAAGEDVGSVVKIVGSDDGEGSKRSMAAVQWGGHDDRGTRLFRLGHGGKVELTCIDVSDGGPCYYQHLPLLSMSDDVHQSSPRQCELTFAIGDLVQLMDIDLDVVRALQDSLHRASGPDDWEEMCFEVGRVIGVYDDVGFVLVFFKRVDSAFMIHSAAITKVLCFAAGERVSLIADTETVRTQMSRLGGWIVTMDQHFGKIGEVIRQDADYNVYVKFGVSGILVHPACLTKTHGAFTWEKDAPILSTQPSRRTSPAKATATEVDLASQASLQSCQTMNIPCSYSAPSSPAIIVHGRSPPAASHRNSRERVDASPLPSHDIVPAGEAQASCDRESSSEPPAIAANPAHTSSPSPCDPGKIAVGDLVQVVVTDEDVLQHLHSLFFHHTPADLVRRCFKVGRVIAINEDMDGNQVFFPRESESKMLHSACLEKVLLFAPGESVQLIQDGDMIKQMMSSYEGSYANLEKFVGVVGEVLSCHGDLNIRVKLGRDIVVVHPGCLVRSQSLPTHRSGGPGPSSPPTHQPVSTPVRLPDVDVYRDDLRGKACRLPRSTSAELVSLQTAANVAGAAGAVSQCPSSPDQSLSLQEVALPVGLPTPPAGGCHLDSPASDESSTEEITIIAEHPPPTSMEASDTSSQEPEYPGFPVERHAIAPMPVGRSDPPPSLSSDQDGSSSARYSPDVNEVSAGDLVMMECDPELLEQIQSQYLKWSPEMVEMRFEVGRVISVHEDVNSAHVLFTKWQLSYSVHTVCLSKVPRFVAGDKVTLILNRGKVQQLMARLGGWDSTSRKHFGIVGEVVRQQEDLDVLAKFGVDTVLLHPACLVKTNAPHTWGNDTAAASSRPRSIPAAVSVELPPSSAGGSSAQNAKVEAPPAACTGAWAQTNSDRNADGVLSRYISTTPRTRVAPELACDTIHKPCLALESALQTGNEARLEEVVDLHKLRLKERFGTSRSTYMHVAAYVGHGHAVELLASHGCPLERHDAKGRTPLHVAVLQDKPGAALALLRRRASPLCRDAKEMIPLHVAALKGNTAMAQLLVTRGRVNAVPVSHQLEAVHKTGLTPLMVAVYCGVRGCVEYLTSEGANVHFNDERTGTSCVLAAVKSQTLVENGDVLPAVVDSEKDPDCFAPEIASIQADLTFTTEKGNRLAAIACFLARRGCNIQHLDKLGMSVASQCANDTMRELLWAHSNMSGPIPSAVPSYTGIICDGSPGQDDRRVSNAEESETFLSMLAITEGWDAKAKAKSMMDRAVTSLPAATAAQACTATPPSKPAQSRPRKPPPRCHLACNFQRERLKPRPAQ